MRGGSFRGVLGTLPADLSPFHAFAVVFGLSAVVCLISLGPARHIDDTETRQGLMWLLGLTAAWAGAHVGYLLGPSRAIQELAFVSGLVIGLAAVGPWLYFCSAYTGRTLHRRRSIQLGAIAFYLVIVGIKVTNAWHGWYYTAVDAPTSGSTVVFQANALHWAVMAVSYLLAVLGMFMLFELFAQIRQGRGGLYMVVGLAGLPARLDIGAALTPQIPDLTYSSIGVAAFAVGVCWIYLDRFQAARRTGEADHPSIVVDDDGVIKEYNRSAVERFPPVKDSDGSRMAEVLPELDEHVAGTSAIIRQDGPHGVRFYQVTSSSFSKDRAGLGRTLTLTDITEQEEYRRQLERQNERLEKFAGILSHDLRGPLTVAMGQLDLLAGELESERIGEIEDALARMDDLMDDALALARGGQPVDEVELVDLRELVEDCWTMAGAEGATLHVRDSIRFEADPSRTRQLLENLFRNALEHGGSHVTVEVGPTEDEDGFYVADDGPGITPADREKVFEWGHSSREAGTGFGLAIVSEIARAHGWEVTVGESPTGGARFVISRVSRSS